MPRTSATSGWRRFDLAHALERARAELARALEQSLVLDHLERGERRGAADRALFVRVMAERAVGGDVEVAARDQRGHGEHRATQALTEHDHVRHDAVVLEREHAARAPEADRDFVEDQERAVAVAGVADDAVVLGRRNLHVGAADGFDDHRADVLFLARARSRGIRRTWRCTRRRRKSGTRRDRTAARARFPAGAGPCPCGTRLRRRSRSRRARRRESCPTATASCAGRWRGGRASAPCRSRACRRARTAPCRAGRARARRASPRDRRPPRW